jgi:hypothetical protein
MAVRRIRRAAGALFEGLIRFVLAVLEAIASPFNGL